VAGAVRGNKSFTADLYPLGIARAVRHLRSTEQFFADAAAGTLPAVSLVDPDFTLYSEENPQDIAAGEAFSAAVVNAVLHGPAWPDTLLIWLYDEHGGYYDHVPPPRAVTPDDIPAHNWQLDLPSWLRSLADRIPWVREQFARLETTDNGPATYDRLGFRVPAVIVSPYARPDFVDSTVYDHTSVLRLIEEKWNLPPLTRRDAAATPPLAALDLDGPPTFRQPPVLPASAGVPFKFSTFAAAMTPNTPLLPSKPARLAADRRLRAIRADRSPASGRLPWLAADQLGGAAVTGCGWLAGGMADGDHRDDLPAAARAQLTGKAAEVERAELMRRQAKHLRLDRQVSHGLAKVIVGEL
jgi:hypothetical protein